MLEPKLILAPIDFSESSHEAFEVAINVASRYGADLLLYHAVPVVPRLPQNISIFEEGRYEEELIKDAESQLAALAAKVEEAGVKARSMVTLANDAAMEIVRIAEHEKVGLIIIATHGRTGWRRLSFGSVADKVVRTAHCPVLVFRTEAASASATEEGKHSAAAAPAA